MLNEQLQNELDQEAKAEAKKLTARVPAYRFGYEDGHYDGAEKYAEKWQEAQQRCDHLEQWKKKIETLIAPLIVDGKRDILEALQRAERYEKALNLIAAMGELPDRIKLTIERAITPKTGNDDTVNG